MKISLVTRLVILVATILVAASALLGIVIYTATSAEFVDVQREDIIERTNDGAVEAVVSQLESAYNQGGIPGIVALSRETQDGDIKTPLPFILINSDLQVIASTERPYMTASVTRMDQGGLRIVVHETSDGEALDMELVALNPRELVGRQGVGFGELAVLPVRIDEKSGQIFATRVWRDAAPWIVLVLFLSIVSTIALLKRALKPVDDLTRAAEKLKKGEFPDALKKRGGSIELDRLIDTFNAATDTLAKTDDIRRQFISDIAHELRTPVTNIKGQTEAYRAGLIKTESEFLDTIEAETHLLEHLVNDFQEIAVTDAGQLRLTLQPLPLWETITNILGPCTQQTHTEFENSVPSDLTVLADEERMRQILMNLFDNARRENTGDLKISVSAVSSDDMVCMRFEDNGPGVNKKDQPHIFDRFYRAEKSRNRSTGGAGLGLTIVNGLVLAMGGKISYTDAPTGGATFEIALPRIDV